MTTDEISQLADAWIAYWTTPEGSPLREELALATSDLRKLGWDDPESVWAVILAIHQKDKSIPVQQVLSAGPIEDLLAEHGERFIDRVESEAKRDPSFAKVLGGVWKNAMTDEVWNRLQGVWDRRGWDRIPE